MLMRYRIRARYFYPRSPCGERRLELFLYYQDNRISIHALLAESDLAGPSGPAFLYNFYPRSPCGERRPFMFSFQPRKTISIHALLAESDGKRAQWPTQPEKQFLSTLSLRRATLNCSLNGFAMRYFYPRSPCGERHFRCAVKRPIANFYPRSPCGERPEFKLDFINQK